MTNVFQYTVLDGLDSSVFSVVAYNDHTRELFVRFNSGLDRFYVDVPREDYDSLVESESAGSYYAYNIKETYQSYRLENAELVLVEDEVEESTDDLDVEELATVTPLFKDKQESVVTTNEVRSRYGFDALLDSTKFELGKYSVQWQSPNSTIGGSPEFAAYDIEDALEQFHTAMQAAIKVDLGFDDYKVTSVIKYFE